MSGPTDTTFYCARCLTTFRVDDRLCPNLGCQRPRPSGGWGRMYGPDDVFDRNYRIHRRLALGGAGVTYLAREIGPDGEETGPKVALKVLFATRDEGSYLRRLATEAQILQELDHPNIVQYLGFVHRAGHSPYLITRFEEGGSLLDHMRRVGTLDVRQAAQVCRQVCWALEQAVGAAIVHRDLKPENLLIARLIDGEETPVVRVADFGIAKVQSGLGSGLTRVGAFVGTPQYAAPEQFVGTEPTGATDVYGVGAILYFCITARPVVQFADRLAPEDGYQLLIDSLPPVASRPGEPEDDLRRLNKVLSIAMAVRASDRCTVTELDGLLGAVAAGREPDVEVVLAAMARRAAGVAAPAAPPPEDTFTSEVFDGHRDAAEAGDPPAPVDEGPTGGGDQTTSSASVTPRPAGGTTPQKARGGGRGVLAGLLILAALGAGSLVVGVGATWVLKPALFGQWVGGDAVPPVPLTANESDALKIKDWVVIGASLRPVARAIAAACGGVDGKIVARLVVEPDGSVRTAEVLGGVSSAQVPCAQRALELAVLDRRGDLPVAVDVLLAP